MRISALLLSVAAALAAAVTASAASPVSAGYLWAQPETAVLANPFAQPPAWIVTAPEVMTLAELPLLTTYPWAQVNGAPVHVVAGTPWSL